MKKKIVIRVSEVKVRRDFNGVVPITRIEKPRKAYRRREKFGNKWNV